MLYINYDEGSFEFHVNGFRPTKEVYRSGFAPFSNMKRNTFFFSLFRDAPFCPANTVNLSHCMCHGTFMNLNLSRKQVYDRHPFTITTLVIYTLFRLTNISWHVYITYVKILYFFQNYIHYKLPGALSILGKVVD